MASAERRVHLPPGRITWLLAGVFVLYALCFAYFFVDDEAIPFVYARNLLAGRGLVYNPADGPVEGYSDFLHVLLAAVIYEVTRLLRLPPLSVFAIGKVLSLAWGVATIVVTGMWLRRLHLESAWTRAAALAPLALAGPLAVWSCSSLEASAVVLLIALLCYALSGETPLPGLATVAAILLALERVDGWIWVGGVAAGFVLFGSPAQRRVALRNLLLPAAAATALLEVFRVLYFHEWLSMPIYAKVLFKLHDNGQLVTKMPEASYLGRYIQLVSWPFAALVGTLAALALHRRDARALAAAVILLAIYVDVVGDWMFGFRFVAPLLAPVFVTAAVGIDRVRGRAPRVAAMVVVVVVLASAVAAYRLEEAYRRQPNEVPRDNFWLTRSVAPGHFFGPYYSTLAELRQLAPRGATIAYNQAGLLPFALGVPNIDDLGICTRFYAKLPATDVAYTEVGRYEPLTDRPVISARRAYLLNESPAFIVSRTDLLLRANGGRVPGALFGGYYQRRAVSADGQNAIYERTSKPAEEYRSDPALFTENLAHVSRLRGVTLNERGFAPGDLVRAFRFAREEGSFAPIGAYRFRAAFADRDLSVRQIYIDGLHANALATLKLALYSSSGQEVLHRAISIPQGAWQHVDETLVPEVEAAALALTVEGTPDPSARLFIRDLRVMGRTPELEAFVRSTVPFERPR